MTSPSVCACRHAARARSNASPRVGVRTHHAGLGVPLPAIAEGGGQGGGAALVVQGGPAVVDGRVDGDGPHAGGVAVTVAVVVAATVPGGPHVDAAFASSALGWGVDREKGHQVPRTPALGAAGKSRPAEGAASAGSTAPGLPQQLHAALSPWKTTVLPLGS